MRNKSNLQKFNECNRRLRNLIDRGVLKRTRYNGGVRLLQTTLRQGFSIDDIEHVEPYGVSSHAPTGAEPIVISMGGNRDRSIILLVNDRRYKIELNEGEVALHTQFGDYLKLRDDNVIEMKSATKVLIDAPLLELLQQLVVHGESNFKSDVTFDAAMLSGGKNVNHTHEHPGDGTGAGNTGPVV